VRPRCALIRIAITAAAFDAICSTLPEDAPLRPAHRRMPHPRRSGRPRPSEDHAEARYVPIEPHISSLHWFSGGTVERPAGTTRRLC
jgi:hypothetical protein